MNTETKTEGRKKLEQLLNVIMTGDIVVFDGVSRMSRNADIGFQIYQELYDNGVELVFLKESHINTAAYKKPVKQHTTDRDKTDIILKAINEYLMELAKKQNIVAFEQSEKEVSV